MSEKVGHFNIISCIETVHDREWIGEKERDRLVNELHDLQKQKTEAELWKLRALKAEDLIRSLEQIEILRKNALETYKFSLDENGEVVV